MGPMKWRFFNIGFFRGSSVAFGDFAVVLLVLYRSHKARKKCKWIHMQLSPPQEDSVEFD